MFQSAFPMVGETWTLTFLQPDGHKVLKGWFFPWQDWGKWVSYKQTKKLGSSLARCRRGRGNVLDIICGYRRFYPRLTASGLLCPDALRRCISMILYFLPKKVPWGSSAGIFLRRRHFDGSIFLCFTKGVDAGFPLSPGFGFAGCLGLVEHKFFDFFVELKRRNKFFTKCITGETWAWQWEWQSILFLVTPLREEVLVSESITQLNSQEKNSFGRR